ncbi:MAG: type IV secretory system conjugative DNA transfer family protein [Aquisalinus sp.]|nr:type IV secretory system conjugative DNA transfer family protein [Aquisalinus sp.]
MRSLLLLPFILFFRLVLFAGRLSWRGIRALARWSWHGIMWFYRRGLRTGLRQMARLVGMIWRWAKSQSEGDWLVYAGMVFGLIFWRDILGLLFGLLEAIGDAMSSRSVSRYYGDPTEGMTIRAAIWGFIAGCVLGLVAALLRLLFSRHAWVIASFCVFVLILWGESTSDMGSSVLASTGTAVLSFVAGLSAVAALLIHVTPATKHKLAFGTSRWATAKDLMAWGLLRARASWHFMTAGPGDGMFLGTDESNQAIVYDGDMHGLTVAPTRRGKGACSIIPNLLRSNSPMIVVDPKGENARQTVLHRQRKGQAIHVVDPWAISTAPDRYADGIDPMHLSCFNPLEALDPESPDLASDAMMLATALVLSTSKEAFWDEEAKALIYGFILYVVTDEREKDQRHLGRVRDILCLPPAIPLPQSDKKGGKDKLVEELRHQAKLKATIDGTIDEIVFRMLASDNPIVRSSAYRYRQKDERERAGVVSTAQANTHFLDTPLIRESLSKSDFSFADMKLGTAMTVYLTLPLDRLPTFNRWLRLMVTSALIQLMRVPHQEGRPPVRMILDEFAALGKLDIVKSAYSTMAGLGVQLHAVTQDLSQLMELYGEKAWGTFVANAGFFQYFGSRDHETAKYAEHLCGVTTMKKRSIAIGFTQGRSGSLQSGSGWSTSESETITVDDVQRPLAYADEMMTLDTDEQVIWIENKFPIKAKKWWYFRHKPKAGPGNG